MLSKKGQTVPDYLVAIAQLDSEFLGEATGMEFDHPVMGPTRTFDTPDSKIRTALFVPLKIRTRKDCELKRLGYHVPKEFRGPTVNSPAISKAFKTLGTTVQRGEKGLRCAWEGRNGRCTGVAVNASCYCEKHGGDIHILDMERDNPEFLEAALKYGLPIAAKYATKFTRAEMFKRGILGAADLDDEELAKGQIRTETGFTKSDMVPREVHDRFVAEIFNRADTALRSSLVDVAKSMVTIATSPEYEAKDRINAGKFIFERVRGKTPDVILNVGPESAEPWEEMFDGVIGGSRAESREARAVASRGGEMPVLEGEVEPEEGEFMDAEYEADLNNTFRMSDSEDAPLERVETTRKTAKRATQPTKNGASDEAEEPEKPEKAEFSDTAAEDAIDEPVIFDLDSLVAANRSNSTDDLEPEEDSQYDYTSIDLVDDNGEDYTKVVARPKPGTGAEKAQALLKLHEKARKLATKWAKNERKEGRYPNADDIKTWIDAYVAKHSG